MDNSTKKLITHDGSFHTDDVFAAAALSIYLENKGENFEIIRTRDEEIIKSGDYVFDVGGVYDADAKRFDHHQPGGAGERENKIPYSSFGLVWKAYGTELAGTEAAAKILEDKLVAPVDAFDNGVVLTEKKYDIMPYIIQFIFFAMHPTWVEGVERADEFFLKSVNIAKEVLKREIIQTRDALAAEDMVRKFYDSSPDKRIVVMDRKYPFQEVLIAMPEPLFAVYPRSDGSWSAKAILADLRSFTNRKNFPSAWAGLRGEELEKASGVSGAVFCHRGLFLAVAKTKEGAIALAKKAL